jgi:hypothetical protein
MLDGCDVAACSEEDSEMAVAEYRRLVRWQDWIMEVALIDIESYA